MILSRWKVTSMLSNLVVNSLLLKLQQHIAELIHFFPHFHDYMLAFFPLVHWSYLLVPVVSLISKFWFRILGTPFTLLFIHFFLVIHCIFWWFSYSQMYSFSQDLSSEFQDHISNHLLENYTWMFNRHLQHDMSKAEVLE